MQIKQAVEKEYNVTVTGVRTMIVRGKRRTRYTKTNILQRPHSQLQEGHRHPEGRRDPSTSTAASRAMGVRKFNPVTPGTRHAVITDHEGITTHVPEPSLTSGRTTRAAAATTRAR